VAEAALAAGLLDQDAAHGFGGGGEEVAPAVPPVRLPAADQSEVGLVDQGGRLQGLARLLFGHPGGRELSQLTVDEWQQLGRGRRVPARGRVQRPRPGAG
jgi:hypothetical protein